MAQRDSWCNVTLDDTTHPTASSTWQENSGRESMEQLWCTLAFDKLLQSGVHDAETLEVLELVRGDLCEYGLQDQQSGLPHYKPTGFLTASASVKERLSRRCQGNHWHQPLEGGQRTRQAQQWSEELCKQIFLGFEEELHSRNVYAAFHNEEIQEQMEEDMDFGTLDAIMDEDDLAPRDLQRDGLNEVELHRQEELEELPAPKLRGRGNGSEHLSL